MMLHNVLYVIQFVRFREFVCLKAQTIKCHSSGETPVGDNHANHSFQILPAKRGLQQIAYKSNNPNMLLTCLTFSGGWWDVTDQLVEPLESIEGHISKDV